MSDETFLDETVLAMKGRGKTPNDILWIGSEDGEYAISWDEFRSISKIEYDSGFGAQEIASDLVVVFVDGSYLSRGEYDGSEWWEYHSTPKQQENPKKFNQVKATKTVGWERLKEMNEP